MRALWWLLKLVARAGTRVRRAWAQATEGAGVFDEMSGRLDGTPRANLADFLAGAPAEVAADLIELATMWKRSFCGGCGAGPDAPTERCAVCRAKLDELIKARSDDELARLERHVRQGEF